MTIKIQHCKRGLIGREQIRLLVRITWIFPSLLESASIRTSNRKLTASAPCSEFFSELTQVRIGDILLSKLLSIIKGSQKNPNSTLAVQLLVSSLNCSGRHFGSCYTRKGKKFKMSEIFKNMI